MPEQVSLSGVLQAMLRGIFSTGRMFLVNDDYSYISEQGHMQEMVKSTWFQLVFWLSHVLALFVSVSAVLSVFGRRLLDEIKLRLGIYKCTYIICGADSRALTLGKNIALHDMRIKKPDRKRLIVFVSDSFSETARTEIEDIGGVALTGAPKI
jgi:hypothetical protein